MLMCAEDSIRSKKKNDLYNFVHCKFYQDLIEKKVTQNKTCIGVLFDHFKLRNLYSPYSST